MLTRLLGGQPTPSAARSGQGPVVEEERRSALLALLRRLEAQGYDFVPPTPATHARVVARPDRQRAKDLRDVLGWSLPFARGMLPGEIEDALEAGGVLGEDAEGLRAKVRVSRVEGTLFLHSAYPTTAQDSVFLGPDSYRFALLIAARMGALPTGAEILDYGAGAGVGGIIAARRAPGSMLTIADNNPKALFLASINAEHAGMAYRVREASGPKDVPGSFALIVTHPPFMMDRDRRAYRDGGDLHGGQLSLEWVLAGVEMLAPGGRLILHSGASIVDGCDVLRDALLERLPASGLEVDYHELDPDIFGDELDQPAYADVERIAAVGLVVTRSALGRAVG